MTDVTVLTPDATWMTSSSARRTGSSSARSPRQRRCGAAAVESGKDRDGVDACDQHWHVVHGWEDWEGDDGSGVATEDDDDTDVGAGGMRTISWGSSSADFWRGLSGGGGRQ